eukprot:gene33466-41294_t
MGTRWSATLDADDSLDINAFQQDLAAAVDQVDLQISPWKPDSDLMRVNRAPVDAWVEVPAELLEVLACALDRSRPTGEEAKQIANELRNWVAKEIGPIAKPKDIRFGDNLPKTRSGKIMRRLLRSIAKGEAITQDTSTLENPAILDQLAKAN